MHNEIPSDFPSQTALLTCIAKKVSEDGVSGELVAFLAKKNIVIADDIAKGVTAAGHYSDYLSFSKTGQKYCHERDQIVDPIIEHVSGSYQFLKAYYNPPAVSPLKQYLTKNGIVLADDITSCAAAALKDAAMFTAKSNAKVSHNHMSIVWTIPMQHIRTIGNFLMKLYAGNEQQLSDYGYKIVASAKSLKTRNLKIQYGISRLNQRAKIGGAFINKGTETLHIYAGKTITGTPVVLLAGEKLIVAKGYSCFCATNTSVVNSANLQVVPPKNVD